MNVKIIVAQNSPRPGRRNSPASPFAVLSILMGAVLAFSAPFAPTHADEPKCRQEVHFAGGAVETTVKGTIKGYAYCDYVFSAAKGQHLQTWLSGAHKTRATVNLVSPVEVELSPDGEVYILPSDGQYTLRVLLIRTFARRGLSLDYSLKIRIDN